MQSHEMSPNASETRTTKIYLRAYGTNVGVTPPTAVCISVNDVFVDRLRKVAEICKQHDLESGNVAICDVEWVLLGEEEFPLQGDVAVVTSAGYFGIEAHYKHIDGCCGSVIRPIEDLAKAVANGVSYLDWDVAKDDPDLKAEVEESLVMEAESA